MIFIVTMCGLDYHSRRFVQTGEIAIGAPGRRAGSIYAMDYTHGASVGACARVLYFRLTGAAESLRVDRCQVVLIYDDPRERSCARARARKLSAERVLK